MQALQLLCRRYFIENYCVTPNVKQIQLQSNGVLFEFS